jgi:DNA gyrase subunit A
VSRQESFLPFAREVRDVPVAEEMSESFLAYSYSVITSRAIPDVRDGLKPVQRRILYSMLDMGLRPTTPHRKSARVVGDTMGKYHPHGDMAIYDALVRMGQDFSRMVTLVDPHGNFGGLDDPPAAARYTECRLTDAAMELVREIDEDTVEWRPTYDGENQEPAYLPGLLPNLLVNGSTGIAVGMATNMPTHNLREVAAAIRLVMTQRRPRPTVDELMALLPGPDFPSGGVVITDDLRAAYETGRGTFRIRARVEVEHLRGKTNALVVTELPFQVGPEKVVARLQELALAGKLPMIADVVNLSGRAGLKVQIVLKSGVNPDLALADLYRQTPLEETFGVNNVVLVNGVPKTLSLYELCQHYVDHRLDVVVRRTQFRLRKAQDELHIIEGLVIALDNIDEVIRIIRASADTPSAKDTLRATLGLSEIQATHILDMQLKRLTALEKQKILDRQAELLALIQEYELLLGSEQRQRTVVLKELDEIVDVYGRERRTEIVDPAHLPSLEHLVDLTEDDDAPEQACLVTLATSAVIGWEPAAGGRRATLGRHDVLAATAMTTTRGTVIAVTSEGRAMLAPVASLSEVTGRGRGDAADKVFTTNRGEEILTILAPTQTEPVVLVTAQGMAKRLAAADIAELRHGKPVMKLRPNDKLAAAFSCPDGAEIIIVTTDAQVLRTAGDDISIQGPAAGGVAGMKVRDGCAVLGAGPALGDGAVVTVSDLGTAKVTPFEEIPAKGRGAQGVRLTRFTKESHLVLAHVAGPDMLLAVMSTDDDPRKPDPVPVPLPVEPTKRDLVSTATDRRILAVGPARWEA